MLQVFRVNLLLLVRLANLCGVVVGVGVEILVFGVRLRLARAEAAHLRVHWGLAQLLVGLRVSLSWVLHRRDHAKRAN